MAKHEREFIHKDLVDYHYRLFAYNIAITRAAVDCNIYPGFPPSKIQLWWLNIITLPIEPTKTKIKNANNHKSSLLAVVKSMSTIEK